MSKTTISSISTVKSKLTAIIARTRLVEAGRIHMVGFDTLKDALGDRWVSVRERVLTYAENRLTQHLSSQDAFFRYGDEEFLIVFANLSNQAAQMLVGKVAEEVHQFILGSPDTQSITIKSAVQQVDGELLFQDLSLAEVLAVAHNQSTETPKKPRGNTAFREKSPPGKMQGSLLVEDTGDITGEIGPPELTPVSFVFRPLWDVKNKRITTYRCVPTRRMAAGYTVEQYAVLNATDGQETVLDLDIATLHTAARTLSRVMDSGFVFACNVTVHYETMSRNDSRRAYIEAIDQIPVQLRRFFIVELTELPVGIPMVRFAEFTSILNARIRAISCRIPLDTRNLQGYGNANLFAVTIDLGDIRKSEGEIMKKFDQIAAAAANTGLKTCITGIKSTSLAIAAAASGITYIGGKSVRDDRKIPGRVITMTWSDYFGF
ncbi:diguanylate cyclase domain-containing protein [Thalassospira marina]|uniref:GGDEF domain-containing protein n=1 Tax=Thalassospira marina TaxID=2048283 RepID=A0ABM6QBA9_9PROT|nr:diguanylate cyclase [Thalassospira marina]AUG53833.1 hypothetical protein CSC3H3_14775 [Thalassospira marina]